MVAPRRATKSGTCARAAGDKHPSSNTSVVDPVMHERPNRLSGPIAFDEASRRNLGLRALHAWIDADASDWPGIDWSTTESMAEEVLAERLAGWQETLSRCAS